jgi:Domain of unknown function (DUF4381)
VIALALLLALQQPRGATSSVPAPPRPQTGVQMGVRARPDTVTVGDPFVVTLRVRAPRGAEIGFPVGPDSGTAIEAVDPRAVRASADTTAIDQTATYRLVAWDTGAQTVRFGEFVVSLRGTDRRIAVDPLPVYVRSVLPRDTAKQIPKPARDIVTAPRVWWWWLIAALVALALLGLFLWWWRRRRKRPAAVEPADPLAEAQREFARIDSLRLLEAGERGRYVALNIEVLRDYLAARVDVALRSLTSTELLNALRSRREVPAERLAPVLAEADLIKFARRPVTSERAREIAREARAIVTDVERAVTAEQERAAEQAA